MRTKGKIKYTIQAIIAICLMCIMGCATEIPTPRQDFRVNVAVWRDMDSRGCLGGISGLSNSHENPPNCPHKARTPQNTNIGIE